ncbi:ATP-binding protein [Deinococcus apachensis]|uniref:ATP-binding cassette domain-containing protein n=1 Tax=Deinococcus apachensis TaxID=309886 RepID=UPI0009FE3067
MLVMRIKGIHIENFRAITRLSVRDLSDVVVIAGPNGCGKSCIFDAIRMLKSIYGGYQPNEWQHWFSEFQISVNQTQELLSQFQNRNLPMIIQIEIEISQEEKQWLRDNVGHSLEKSAWRRYVPDLSRGQKERGRGETPAQSHFSACSARHEGHRGHA